MGLIGALVVPSRPLTTTKRPFWVFNILDTFAPCPLYPEERMTLYTLIDMEYPASGLIHIENFDSTCKHGAGRVCWLRQMKTYLARITVQLWLTAAVVLMVTTYECVAAQARSADDLVRFHGSHFRLTNNIAKSSLRPSELGAQA